MIRQRLSRDLAWTAALLCAVLSAGACRAVTTTTVVESVTADLPELQLPVSPAVTAEVATVSITSNVVEDATQAVERRGADEEALLTDAIESKRAKALLHWPWVDYSSWNMSLVAYLSLRMHVLYFDDDWTLADGGSRAGLMWDHDLKRGISTFARGEIGFDALDTFDQVVTRDASTAEGRDSLIFNPRLYYAGIRGE